MATTPGLGLTLPEIGEATAATLQLFLVWVEAISLGKLKDHDQNTPPGSPAEGKSVGRPLRNGRRGNGGLEREQ